MAKIGDRVEIINGGLRPACVGLFGKVVDSSARRAGEFWPESGLNIALEATPADGFGNIAKGVPVDWVKVV